MAFASKALIKDPWMLKMDDILETIGIDCIPSWELSHIHQGTFESMIPSWLQVRAVNLRGV